MLHAHTGAVQALGKHFIGIEELLGHDNPARVFQCFDRSLPREADRGWCQEQEMFVLPRPLQGTTLSTLCPRGGRRGVDLSSEAFMREGIRERWFAIQHEPLRGSVNLPLHKQRDRLPSRTELAPAIYVVWAFKVVLQTRTLEIIPRGFAVRTASSTQDGRSVVVYNTIDGRLEFGAVSSHHCDEKLATIGIRRL